MKRKVLIVFALLFFVLYQTKGVYFSVLGLPIIFSICYLIIFVTITFYFSKGFFWKRFYFWKKENEKENFTFLIISNSLLVLFGSLLFPLNDSKELGNQIIWGCYIEYAMGGVVFIWVLGLVFSVILLIIELINPNKIRFESRKKLLKSLSIINLLTFLLIFIFYISVKLISSNLHGASWSC